MQHAHEFYIKGAGVDPAQLTTPDVINQATGLPFASNAMGSAADVDRAVAWQMRAGTVNLNGPDGDMFAPFGGYKQSGNGRAYADWGMAGFLEAKGIVGFGEA